MLKEKDELEMQNESINERCLEFMRDNLEEADFEDVKKYFTKIKEKNNESRNGS